MKLAIATTFLQNMNGVARVVLKIAEEFDAVVFTTDYAKEKTFQEFRNLDVRTIGHGRNIGRFGSGINAGIAFYNLKLNDFDLVNPHQSPSEWVVNNNSPVLWYCHTPNREAFDLYDWRMKNRNILQKAAFWPAVRIFRHFERMLVPKIGHIFTNSKTSQKRVKQYLNCESEILYPGVDFEKYKHGNYGKYFVYPGRIAPEKDIEFVITAFKKFSSQQKGYKLKIIGSLSDNPSHKKYYDKICELAAGSSVEFITNASEEKMRHEIENSLSTVYSPIDEDFGLIPIESMAAYKPTIAKNEGGPTETIANGVDGFLVNSPQEMAARMLEFVKRPELAEEMGKVGRKKAEKNFNWKSFLKRFKEKAVELTKNKN